MRVQNNTLTHGDFLSPLESFHLNSQTANYIFIAAVTTGLSYQLTALSFDLLFGRRQRGQTPAHDIHIQLLTDEPSPLSMAAAVSAATFSTISGFTRRYRKTHISPAPLHPFRVTSYVSSPCFCSPPRSLACCVSSPPLNLMIHFLLLVTILVALPWVSIKIFPL